MTRVKPGLLHKEECRNDFPQNPSLTRRRALLQSRGQGAISHLLHLDVRRRA